MNAMQTTDQPQHAGPATPEQIRELPRRYSIGKRPLSRLLGWGELTYTRLLDGGVPNAAHSDEIRRLLDDPAAYARVLEIGREHNLITNAAYIRSRRAVDDLLAESIHDEAGDPLKIFAVADRICALTEGDVTPRTLQRLMHAAQERARDVSGEPLFSQAPRSTEWGPEYPQISAGYSFEAIQSVAARMRKAASWPVLSGDAQPSDRPPAAREADDSNTGKAPDAPPSPSSLVGGEGSAVSPDAESPKKRGKKGKKGKKLKDKGKKKGKKKGQAAAKGAATDAASPADPGQAAASADGAMTRESSTPAAQPTAAAPFAPARTEVHQGPLSPAECRIVDEVVNRYQGLLASAFEA